MITNLTLRFKCFVEKTHRIIEINEDSCYGNRQLWSGNMLVDYNGATEVLAGAEIHGHTDTFCVTVCHPGVDPSVPMAITGSGRMSVVETNDMGEGLLRLYQKSLSQEQLWQWLATPGQAISVDLPYTEH